jgi:hypothetical protein
MLLSDDICLVLSPFPFPAVRPRYAGEFNSSRTCPMPLFRGLKVQETSDSSDLDSFLIISVAGEFPRHNLALYSASDYLQNLVVDRMTMRCLTRPPRTCDSDVAACRPWCHIE